MAFNSYITYDEYMDLGGKVPEDAFPYLVRKSQRYLDYITFNRISELETIPDEVKEVLTEFINEYYNFEIRESENSGISKYSNGTETIEYRKPTETELSRNFYSLACKWLPDYLLARSVKFDVKQHV